MHWVLSPKRRSYKVLPITTTLAWDWGVEGRPSSSFIILLTFPPHPPTVPVPWRENGENPRTIWPRFLLQKGQPLTATCVRSRSLCSWDIRIHTYSTDGSLIKSLGQRRSDPAWVEVLRGDLYFSFWTDDYSHTYSLQIISSSLYHLSIHF